MGNIVSSFPQDAAVWVQSMQKLPRATQIWARLFPFPQLGLGLIFLILLGANCLAAWYFYARVASFIVAIYVHKWRPYTKLMGPIMHFPFFGPLVPCAWWWIFDGSRLGESMNWVDFFHFWFIVYTTILTTISLVLDGTVVVKWLLGKEVGLFIRDGDTVEGLLDCSRSTDETDYGTAKR